MSEIKVRGLSELNQFLQQLPAKIEANVLRGALRAGAKVILMEARRLAPVGPPNSENARLYGGYEGALRDSIRVGATSKRGRITAYVKAGGKSAKTKADVYYAHFLEYGTAAHKITAAKGGWLFFGKFAKAVMHPGIQPRPFMRPALESQAQEAVLAAANYMKARLASKHGLDTSDVEIAAQ